MRAQLEIFALAVVCAGTWSVGTPAVTAQEATSAHLPDQFQTGAKTSSPRPKKDKAEQNPQTHATTRKRDIAPPSQPTPPAKELPPALTTEKKETETHQAIERKTSKSPSTNVTKPAAPKESSARESKPRSKNRSRPRPPVQPEATISREPVPVSLSVARSMAIKAPLPRYPYEAKRRDLTGSGICVLTVDAVTGKVTNVTMTQSTGSRFLDKFTVQTFRDWRFKPGTVSQLRIPISYE